ncbi:hypothetical protein ACJX0J_041935, partial [Zea mays]
SLPCCLRVLFTKAVM